MNDDALHHDNADGQHGELKSKRDTLNDVTHDIMARDPPIFTVQVQLRVLHKRIEEAANRADELRAHRGDGCTGYAPAERDDKEQVEPHIEHCGK